MDYRGYGNSDGTPSEHGLVADAQATLDWLLARNDIDKTRVFLHGQSLGGAVAIKCAHLFQERVCGTMVENTFTSIDDMVIHLGTELYKFAFIARLRPFFSYFLTSHWPSVRLVADVRSPLLFLSGQRDELVPPAHMTALHQVHCIHRRRLSSH